MKTFDLIKCYLKISGITSTQSTRKDLLKIQNILFFVVLALNIISTALFGYYEAKTFDEYVDSYFAVSSAFSCFYTYGVLFWDMPNLYQFTNTLEIFVNQRLIHPTSKRIYTKPDKRIGKLNEILRLVFVVIPVLMIVPKYIVCIITYFTTDAGNDAFETPVPGQWFPFDWKNPFGYTMACTFQFMVVWDVFIGMLWGATFSVGTVVMLVLITNDLKCELESINLKLKAKPNRVEVTNHFFILIKMHSDIKHLIKAFCEPMKLIFLNAFVWCISNICCAMTLIQTELADSGITVTAIYRMYQMFASFGMVFFICELGHHVSSAFEQTNHAIGNLKWYLLPIGIWKMLPIVIAGANNPVVFTVFGTVSCSRKDFKAAVHSGYSYFMLLGNLRS